MPVINKFKEKNESYYWYGLKQQANIISDKEGEKKAFEFIKSKFNPFPQKTTRCLNWVRGFIFLIFKLSILFISKK